MHKHIRIFIGVFVFGLVGVGIFAAFHLLQVTDSARFGIRPKHAQVLAAETNSQTLFLETPDTVTVGKEFAVPVKVNTSIPVNAVEAHISFSSDVVSVVRVIEAGSAFDVAVVQKISGNTVTITRGSLTPLTGTQLVATIILKARSQGVAQFSIQQDSKLVSSSTNSNILSLFDTQSVVISSQPVTATPTVTPFIPSPTVTLRREGFSGEYFNNVDFAGTPILTRFDRSIDFKWGQKAPARSVSRDKYSVRWTKNEFFSGGTYRFQVRHDDGMRIFVDGRQVYNIWRDQSARRRVFLVPMSAGVHEVTVEYYENRGKAIAQVDWKLQRR